MKNKIWTCLIILTIAAVNVSCNSETECKHIDSQVTSKEAQSKDFQSENSEKNVEDTEEYSGSDNPIDKYFTPKLKSWDISEVELRENREAYKKAWKAEYKNVMKSLKKKCVYQYNRHRFFNERLCGMVNSRIWICEEAVCGDEREHGAAFE